jgi:hypothetical protein
MSQLDLTNIANASIATPAAGVTSLFVDTSQKYRYKNSSGVLVPIKEQSVTATVTSGGTLNMTNASSYCECFTGTLTHTAILPNATTLVMGDEFFFDNNSTQAVTVQMFGGGALCIVAPGTFMIAMVMDVSTTAGTWMFDYSPTIAASGDSLTVPPSGGTAVVLTGTQAIPGVKTMTNPTTLAGTTGVPSMTITAGTLMTSPTAGVVEADSTANYATINTTNGRTYDDAYNFFKLAANGSAQNLIQDFFGTNDGIPMVGTAVYEIEWHCFFAIAALAGTVTWTLTNTGTLTNMVASYEAVSAAAGLVAIGATRGAGVVTSTTAIQVLPVSDSLTITTNHYHIVRALIEQNGTGNLRLRITCGTTTTALPLRGSYFKVRRLPVGNVGTFVA